MQEGAACYKSVKEKKIMKKWSQKLSLAILCAGLLALIPNAASAYLCDPCCDPCYDPCCLGGFEVGIDFIYWKPCIDELDWGATVETENNSPVTTTVKYKSICPDWEPGIRVYFGMPEAFCDLGLAVHYTLIGSDDSSSAEESEGVVTPLQHQGPDTDSPWDEGKGTWDLCYHEWDVLLTYDISCTPCHNFKPYFGLAGIYLEQELDVELIEGSDTSGVIEWESRYWGVGLRFGSEYKYRMNQCLSIFALCEGTLLAGEADNDNKQTYGTSSLQIIEIKDDDCCHFVPGFHIGAGILYDGCVCNNDFTIKLGYEFIEWRNVPNHRVFTGDNSGSESSHATSSNIRTLGFHGLMAGLYMSF